MNERAWSNRNKFELTGRTENHPKYQALAEANLARQYDFLRSMVQAALETNRPFLSQTLIRTINFHAIACLHTKAGEYRPCEVRVGDYNPPEHYRVNDMLDDFVNSVNRCWESADPIWLAAYVLWRLNHIHPFINGNGRTARATCYFVICLKIGDWPNTATILPELLRNPNVRSMYRDALRTADASESSGTPNLAPLFELLTQLLNEQYSPSNPSVS